MHDKQACYGQAMRTMIAWRGRNPALLAQVRAGDQNLLAALARHPGMHYLRHTMLTNTEEGRVPTVEALAARADLWLDGAEASAVANLWDAWTADGTLASLGKTDRVVLTSIFAWALHRGRAQVIAATRHTALLATSQYGRVSHEAVRLSYKRLHDLGLIEVTRVSDGWTRRSSSRVSLTASLRSSSGWPSDSALAALTLTDNTLAALHAYRVEAYQRRTADLRQTAPEAPGAAPASISNPLGGSGFHQFPEAPGALQHTRAQASASPKDLGKGCTEGVLSPASQDG